MVGRELRVARRRQESRAMSFSWDLNVGGSMKAGPLWKAVRVRAGLEQTSLRFVRTEARRFSVRRAASQTSSDVKWRQLTPCPPYPLILPSPSPVDAPVDKCRDTQKQLHVILIRPSSNYAKHCFPRDDRTDFQKKRWRAMVHEATLPMCSALFICDSSSPHKNY